MTAHKMTEDWLLAYAAGTLNEGQSLVTACHLAYHPEMMDVVRGAERIGGALLENLPASEVPDGTFDALMARLDEPEPAPDIIKQDIITGAPAVDGIPAALSAYIGGGYDHLRWRFLGPGLRHALLWKGPEGEKAWLLRGVGDRVIPEHGHAGEEWTLVLKGAYEAQGERFCVGDIEFADPDTQHSPMLDPNEECICLAYTSHRIRPKSPLVRFLQPFLGM